MEGGKDGWKRGRENGLMDEGILYGQPATPKPTDKLLFKIINADLGSSPFLNLSHKFHRAVCRRPRQQGNEKVSSVLARHPFGEISCP